MSGETVDPPVGWERAGYVLRWTDDFNSGTVITSNRTINTVWKKLYTVTFRDPSDNKESVVTGVEEGTEASTPNWRKKGYRLTWSTENYKRVNSDLTVDAVWLVSLTDETDQPEQSGQKKGDQITVGNIVYKISSITDKRVRVMSLVDESVTNVTIPNTISYGGRTYSVTCINANAFRGNQFLKKITLGTKLRSIEHYAFYNCPKLEKIVINSKSLVNVSNYALKKLKTSLKVYANKGTHRFLSFVTFGWWNEQKSKGSKKTIIGNEKALEDENMGIIVFLALILLLVIITVVVTVSASVAGTVAAVVDDESTDEW